jgi:predicted small lipoprotein YifL
MKKIISILLLLLLALSLAACGNQDPKEISCEEIITAYENAGYTVEHHMHHDADTDADAVCNILIKDSKNPERDYIYIDRYSNEEGAKSAAEETAYNPVLWFVFGVNGEWRWLKSEHYGDIHYHTYNSKMTKPLEKLME